MKKLFLALAFLVMAGCAVNPVTEVVEFATPTCSPTRAQTDCGVGDKVFTRADLGDAVGLVTRVPVLVVDKVKDVVDTVLDPEAK